MLCPSFARAGGVVRKWKMWMCKKQWTEAAPLALNSDSFFPRKMATGHPIFLYSLTWFHNSSRKLFRFNKGEEIHFCFRMHYIVRLCACPMPGTFGPQRNLFGFLSLRSTSVWTLSLSLFLSHSLPAFDSFNRMLRTEYIHMGSTQVRFCFDFILRAKISIYSASGTRATTINECAWFSGSTILAASCRSITRLLHFISSKRWK